MSSKLILRVAQTRNLWVIPDSTLCLIPPSLFSNRSSSSSDYSFLLSLLPVSSSQCPEPCTALVQVLSSSCILWYSCLCLLTSCFLAPPTLLHPVTTMMFLKHILNYLTSISTTPRVCRTKFKLWAWHAGFSWSDPCLPASPDPDPDPGHTPPTCKWWRWPSYPCLFLTCTFMLLTSAHPILPASPHPLAPSEGHTPSRPAWCSSRIASYVFYLPREQELEKI